MRFIENAEMALNLSGEQEQTEPVKQGTSENIATENYLDTNSLPGSFAKLVFIPAASTNLK